MSLFFIPLVLQFLPVFTDLIIRNRTFSIDPAYGDTLYSLGLTENFAKVQSLIKCGIYCGYQDCASFSFSEITEICYIYSVKFPTCNAPTISKTVTTDYTPYYRIMDEVFSFQKNLTYDPEVDVRFCPCEFDTTDGTWTVIQQRFDGSVDFERGWDDYKAGFGDPPNGEFWLGLETMNQLTTADKYVLLVVLVDKSDVRKCAWYDNFYIAPESDNYRLTVGEYYGTAGNSLDFHNGMEFTTADRDNDQRSYGNCATAFRGATWHNDCLSQNLNGLFFQESGPESMLWRGFHGTFTGLKSTQMLIKRS